MTKTLKKSLALILSVIMLMSVMPMSFSLAATVNQNNFTYSTSNNGTATVTAYNNSATEVVIPDAITYDNSPYAVTTIGTSNNYNNYGRPFYNNVNITKVTLGNNVQTINSNAFSGCSNLETIVIPKSLTTVNSNAFYKCNNLTTVNYKGSPEDWAKISFTTGNSRLTNATINYYYGHNCSTEGHVTQKVNGTPATCVEAGEMEHWNCIICDADFSDQAASQALETTVIDAPGHSWSETLTQGEESHYIACTVTGCGATKEGTIEAHDWEDATCTTPKTCTVCQKTQGNANDHDWAEEWTITETEHYKECTVDGCGAIKEDTVEAHNKGVQGVDYMYSAPNCQRPGFQGDINCVDCGAFLEIGKTLEKLDHDYVKDEEKSRDATCDENAEFQEGYYYGVCSMCGHIKEERISIPDHSYDVWTESEISPATCVDSGMKFSICTVCGKIGEKKGEINPNKHTELVPTEATPDTCETNGNIAYWTCAGCHKLYDDEDATNEITTVDIVIGAKGHAYGDFVYDEATGEHKRICANDTTHVESEACVDVATDGDCKCDKCGHLVAHSWTDATCTAPKTCTVCGAVDGAANGHNWSAEWTLGETEHYKECTVVGCDAKNESATHTFADATCTAPKTCTVCQKTNGIANGHEWATVWTKGETEHYKECTVEDCDAKNESATHTFADATCTDPKTCTICNKTEGVAKGHAFNIWEHDAETGNHIAVCSNDRTHTMPGVCEDSAEDDDCKCDVCDRLMDHDFAPATCIAPKTCRVCEATEGEINPERHIGNSEVKTDEYREATCVSKEYTKYVTYCLGCDEAIETEEVEGEIDPDNHQKKQVVPNGGKDKVHYYICEREGCEYKENIEHNRSNATIVDQPTCTEKGRLREYCSICKSYIYSEIATIPHVDANKNAKCDVCNTTVELPEDPQPETPTPTPTPKPEDPSANCDCNCHKAGLQGLFFSIILFFQRLLGMNKKCVCGVAHY